MQVQKRVFGDWEGTYAIPFLSRRIMAFSSSVYLLFRCYFSICRMDFLPQFTGSFSGRCKEADETPPLILNMTVFALLYYCKYSYFFFLLQIITYLSFNSSIYIYTITTYKKAIYKMNGYSYIYLNTFRTYSFF